MSIGLLFWLLVLLWLIFGLYWNRTNISVFAMDNAFLFILILLLGIKAFGWPIQG